MRRILRWGGASMAVLLLLLTPVVAGAAEGDSTTTTIEIQISATSIAREQVSEVDDSPSPSVDNTDDTLPFTGTSASDLAPIAGMALATGLILVALSGRSREPASGTRRLRANGS